MKNIYQVEVWFFCHTDSLNSAFWFFRFAVWQYQIRFTGFSFTKKMEKLGRSLASVQSSSIFSTINPVNHAELRAPIFQNQGSFPHASSLIRIRWPQLFSISDTSNSISDSSKKIKENYRVENFGANVLEGTISRILTHFWTAKFYICVAANLKVIVHIYYKLLY